jgi:hypothetical protein
MQADDVSADKPLRIRVDDESRATKLAGELTAYGAVELRRRGGRWELALEGATSNGIVASALGALQRSLDADPTGAADVLLDGREYRMHGDNGG